MEKNQLNQEKDKLYAQFEEGKDAVLSTSLDNFVTSRTVTLISHNEALYLVSIKRPGAIKIAQIEKNSNIAICFNTTQITGKAIICGLISEELNKTFASLYEEKLPESFNRFAKIPGCVVIKIDVSTYKSWKMVENKIEITDIDFINNSVNKNTI